ncbi:MAG: hypothetical protein KGQ89_06935 [Verrucomicrobia bacterium]|nr:hypothetical protein [Verrucomicrobiota bacterium]
MKYKHFQKWGMLVAVTAANTAHGQFQGPSTGSTPYLLPTLPGYQTTSVLTVDNTGANPDDLVPKVGGGTYGMNGIPDGLGAFDNGDGTFTLLMNHELGNTVGIIRAHGAKGSYVSKWVINKNTLAVVNGEDLIKQAYGWNNALQASDTAPGTFAFNRFCSADLPQVSAYYNATTGKGTQERIFMHGEEGSATGWQNATVVTGPDAGKSYILGKFNLSTNGSGLTGVGAWENALANPFPQDKTIVLGLNDGGTGIMSNALSFYEGTKTNSGSEVDKAGLTNGTLTHILVAGNPAEIVNSTTRATNITNGTAFSLSATSSTTFSRPEDGQWNPKNLSQFFFVTTDRLDLVSDDLGTDIGQTRLWRLTFTDITNPSLGGTIDLLLDGAIVGGEKTNMFDNMTVNEKSGHIILQEDVGGAAHNGKVWDYDPATFTGVTNSGVLKKILKHDVARFGDRVNPVTTPVTAPFNNDEEASGVIDITSIMAGGALHIGNPREAWYISVDQAHYTTGITAEQVQGGQLFTLHEIAPGNNVAVTRGGFVRDRRSGKIVQQITIKNNNPGPLAGPFHVVLDALSPTANLDNSNGSTVNYGPTGSPYITIVIPGPGTLAPGASVSGVLQFTNPGNQAINYSTRTFNSIPTP